MGQPASSPTILRFGIFQLDLENRELRKGGGLIKLQSQPFKVLALLAQRPGQVVTREEIRRSLWGDDTFVDFERGINFSVNQIRTALGDEAQRPRYIETIPRRGYRFLAPVEGLESSTVSEAPSPNAPPVTSVRRTSALRRVAFTLALILVVAAVYLAHRFLSRTQVQAGNIRMVVLPFANFSGDASQEYLSDGVTEEIITQLANLQPERLAVIARTSAMRYKQTEKSVDEIRRELGVDYVLEGSVRRVGDRMRISAQLTQTTDQTHRWAKSYESDVRDILKVENDVARAIAREIEVKLTPQQRARLASARSLNSGAYEAYLKGRYYWNKRTSESFNKSLGYFAQAIEKDPGYALAYAGLADSYALLGDYQFVPSGDAYPKARAAAAKALELDDTLAQAHPRSPSLRSNMIGTGGAPRENSGGPLSSIRATKRVTIGMPTTWRRWVAWMNPLPR